MYRTEWSIICTIVDEDRKGRKRINGEFLSCGFPGLKQPIPNTFKSNERLWNDPWEFSITCHWAERKLKWSIMYVENSYMVGTYIDSGLPQIFHRVFKAIDNSFPLSFFPLLIHTYFGTYIPTSYHRYIPPVP